MARGLGEEEGVGLMMKCDVITKDWSLLGNG